MGMITESGILKAQRRAREETNTRLDALIAEQRRTNELLAALLNNRAVPYPPRSMPEPKF